MPKLTKIILTPIIGAVIATLPADPDTTIPPQVLEAINAIIGALFTLYVLYLRSPKDE